MVDVAGVKAFAEEQLRSILPNGFGGRFFLAGGCFKTLLHGQRLHDLDLWPVSAEDRNSLIKTLQKQGASLIRENEFNTVLENANILIEVTRKEPVSLIETVFHFDLVLSCIGVEYNNGHIVDAYIHHDVNSSVEAKEIRVVPRLNSMLYTLRTLERLQHYAEELNYTIPQSSIDRVWNVYALASHKSELLKAAGLTVSDVPKWATVKRVFIPGQPAATCRPFLPQELKLISGYMQSNTKISQRMAVFITGLPGSGKTSLLNEILTAVGLPTMDHFVNLDMDILRSFHEQFNTELRGISKPNGDIQIYSDLIPWFNEGSNCEHVLYKDDNSLVSCLLKRQFSFILPIHTIASVSFMKFVTKEHHYIPYLLEVQVPVSVAQKRAQTRAMLTGRYASPEYIAQAYDDMVELLAEAREFMSQQLEGKHAVFDNSVEGGGGSPFTPVLSH